MQRIYHFLRGTVRLRISGAFPERCCNICANAGVAFWNVVREDEEHYLFTVSLGDEKKVARLGKKAMCQVEQTEIRGVPGLLSQLRYRYGMAVGVLMVLFLFSVVSQYVLVIDLNGNETLTRSQILSKLQSFGFSIGAYAPDVDERDLANKMLLEFDELSYLSIYISGIHAQVTVRERGPEPEVRDLEEIADVVASRDGVIQHIAVINGREQVQQGDAVVKGEVLISNLITHEMADGSGTVFATDQVRAEGSVRAYTVYHLAASTPLTALVPSGEEETETGYGLEILGRHVNFRGNSSNLDTNCDKIAILYPVTLPDGNQLPLGLWKRSWTNWASEPVKVNEESAEAFLKRQLQEKLTALIGDGEVIQAKWQVKRTDGALTVTLEAQCLEEIGMSVRLN